MGAGQVDRKPDPKGFGYWINELDADHSAKGIKSVANSILHSDEFTTKYGSVDAMSATNYINLLYHNVLNRSPTGSETVYYTNLLSAGYTRDTILMYFANSPEAVHITGTALANGIFYTPYHP